MSDLVFELGAEELPAGNQEALALRLADLFEAALARLNPVGRTVYFAPRRLTVMFDQLDAMTPDEHTQRQGPFVEKAFDADGQPLPAALGFAKGCDLDLDAVARVDTPQGQRLVADIHVKGRPAQALIPEAIQEALTSLSGFQTMRWDASGLQFLRPIRWMAVQFEGQAIQHAMFGIALQNTSFGHRFHHPEAVQFSGSQDYVAALEKAHVLVDPVARRASIDKQIEGLSLPAGAEVVVSDSLLDEVTGLVEWPVVLLGQFDKTFLNLPTEVIATEINAHQKCFHVIDVSGKALNYFVIVSNIDSADRASVIAGNCRVVAARLSDADFFYRQDIATPLSDRVADLDRIVFQAKLGTVGERVARISQLAEKLAPKLAVEPALAVKLAKLIKADLTTQLVGEFPELAGVVGRCLLEKEGMNPEQAGAIEQHMLPRHAGDVLPSTALAQVLALADRLDLLAGFFAINLRPTGDKDPFALRRAALSVLRILIELKLDLDLVWMLDQALDAFDASDEMRGHLVDFVSSRLIAYYKDQGLDIRLIHAVQKAGYTQPLDIDMRVHALKAVHGTQAGQLLAAASKRCGNILRKQGVKTFKAVNASCFQEVAERDLYACMVQVAGVVQPFLAQRTYVEAMEALIALSEPVTVFFDDVRVIVEDPKILDNRLSLLNNLHQLLTTVADLSELE